MNTIPHTPKSPAILKAHAEVCCQFHGCRYHADTICPIVLGTEKQSYRCGSAAVCTEYRSPNQRRN